MIVLAQLAPVVLLPIFYDFKPLDRPGLRDRLVALAERAGAKVLGVFEWRLSDRTRKSNAALTGLGRTRRILLSDTLLADHSDDEMRSSSRTSSRTTCIAICGPASRSKRR